MKCDYCEKEAIWKFTCIGNTEVYVCREHQLKTGLDPVFGEGV